MKIFTPIAASLVLVCVATQGDLIAQNRRDSDLRQQIRRIVREELKRALAEVHETRDRVAPQKKAQKKTAARKKTAPKKKVRPAPSAPSAVRALNRASQALAEARQALAQAQRALMQSHGAFETLELQVPRIQMPRIQMPRIKMPGVDVRAIVPGAGVRTYVFDGGKGRTRIWEVEQAPTKAKKKGMKGDQRKKKPLKAKNKKRSGRIV